MSLQPTGNQYGQVTVSGGVAHLGDQYITVYQDHQLEYRRQWLQFLTSLRYDGMNARFNEISDAGQSTFEWIYNHQQQSLSEPSCFAMWLKDNAPLFLIQGKAGSGKSTLMKFIYEHESTKPLLQHELGQQPPLLLFHSFWIVGTKDQHNFKGLLASLAHQILSARKDLLPVCHRIPGHELKQNLSDWSEKNLRLLFMALCQSASARLCVFLDGVDELDPKDDFDKLIELISYFQQSAIYCKFCLSSRPMPYILQSIGEVPGLRLQDLTKADIFNYVHRTLQQKTSRLPTIEDQKSLDLITALICHKAEGVFLWVYFVLRNVCNGIRIGDDLEALQQRIKTLPSAIGDLYRHMWNLQNDDNAIHAKETSMLFALGRHLPMPLFQLCVALRPALIEHYLRNMSTLSEDYLRGVCENMLKLIQHRSAGLIEFFEIDAYNDDDLNVEGSNFWGKKGIAAHRKESWRRTKIQYMHRTVHDFLTDSEEGQRILGNETASQKQDVDRRWLVSFLACFIEDVRGFSLQTTYELCLSEAWLSQQDGTLIDLMDGLGKRLMLDRRTPDMTEDGHNWVFEMQSKRPEYYLHTDFPGLVVGSSQTCVQHLLFVHGKAWSPYYKGYLALCTIVHIMWNTPVWRSDIFRMLNMLWDLKLAGADFTTPHPYASTSVGVLAVRSPVARLLQEICITILRPRDHRIGMDTVAECLRLLGDLDVSTQKFTIFWTNHYDSTSNGFGISPHRYPCCMIVFDVGTVLRAFSHVVRGSLQPWSQENSGSVQVNMREASSGSPTSFSVMIGMLDINDLRQSLSCILPQLVECIRIIRYSSQKHENDYYDEDDSDCDDEDAQFAECAAEQVQQMFHLMLRGGETDVLDQMNLTDIEPPAWPRSDLNFDDRLEDFRPFMEPLDPHVDIGLHNWMEEGCLKSYFAMKRSSGTTTASSVNA